MNLRWEFGVALRYLWMARKRAHTAFLSLISTLGLAVGVATLLISLALLSGLQGQIKSRLIASSPLLLIEPAGRNTIAEPQEVIAESRRHGMSSIQPTVSGIAWGTSGETGRGQPLRLRSYDEQARPAAEKSFGREWQLPDQDDSIYLTRDAAAGLGIALGDEVTAVAPRTRLTPFGAVPVWKRYVVTRLLPPVLDEESPDGWLPFDEASRLFGTGGLPTSIEIYGGVSESAERVQQKLAARFPDLLVKTWREINLPLFLALRLEKIVMFATISLIIFVAALNLISSLSMMIVEKRPQVGVLRTLGASEQGVLTLFLAVGLLIGLLGTALGNLFGLGLSWIADHYQLISLPGDIYYVSYIPFQIDAADVLGVNVIAITLSILATWYPARIASRLDPIVAIRDE
ncbi:MAG TPA: ABC transporter permease [Thermoanaerobaculia bacterium]|nr:ABC transporter permease [Thermoanaerobaculia bacterium]